MSQRIVLLLAIVLGAIMVGAGVEWAGANWATCLDESGQRLVGCDVMIDAPPIWEVLLARTPAWTLDDILLFAAPFAFAAFGTLADRPENFPGLWIGFGIVSLGLLWLLQDPSAWHDCDRKGSSAGLSLVFLGLPLGFVGMAVGQMMARLRLSR